MLASRIDEGILKSVELRQTLVDDAVARGDKQPILTVQDIRNKKKERQHEPKFGVTEIEVICKQLSVVMLLN